MGKKWNICVKRKRMNKRKAQKYTSVLFKVGNGSYQISEKYTLLKISVTH